MIIITITLFFLFSYIYFQYYLNIGFIWRGVFLFLKRGERLSLKQFLAEKPEKKKILLLDLGAFNGTNVPDLEGVSAVVLMEDRVSEFFLGESGFSNPDEKVPLSRHGPYSQKNIMQFKQIINELHRKKINVIVGFWGFSGSLFNPPTGWLKRHPELKPRDRFTGDINDPFVTLEPEGQSFAEYIGKRYVKLQEIFGFDGLMLGDGFMGKRDFFHPKKFMKEENSIPQWKEFYSIIGEHVHRARGELWAYDCMGLNIQEAQKHGADYRSLASVGLDVLVFQSYPTVWGPRYFNVNDGKLETNKENLESVILDLEGTATRVFVTIEVADKVERWQVPVTASIKQMEVMNIAHGYVAVWANEMLR